MRRFPEPLKLGDCMLTYPEPNVIVEGVLEAKNTVTPVPMIAMPDYH